MGEMNIRLAARKPEMSENPFAFGEVEIPIACHSCYKSGSAISAAKDFGLLLSPVTMIDPKQDAFKNNICGWMKPELPTADFFEAISRAEATHHSILVYDASPEQLNFFDEILGCRSCVFNY